MRSCGRRRWRCPTCRGTAAVDVSFCRAQNGSAGLHMELFLTIPEVTLWTLCSFALRARFSLGSTSIRASFAGTAARTPFKLFLWSRSPGRGYFWATRKVESRRRWCDERKCAQHYPGTATSASSPLSSHVSFLTVRGDAAAIVGTIMKNKNAKENVTTPMMNVRRKNGYFYSITCIYVWGKRCAEKKKDT